MRRINLAHLHSFKEYLLLISGKLRKYEKEFSFRVLQNDRVLDHHLYKTHQSVFSLDLIVLDLEIRGYSFE